MAAAGNGCQHKPGEEHSIHDTGRLRQLGSTACSFTSTVVKRFDRAHDPRAVQPQNCSDGPYALASGMGWVARRANRMMDLPGGGVVVGFVGINAQSAGVLIQFSSSGDDDSWSESLPLSFPPTGTTRSSIAERPRQ